MTSLSLASCYLTGGKSTGAAGGLNQRDFSGLQVLCDALQLSSTVRTLDLSRNALQSEGACILGAMLESNESITALDISSNDLTNDGTSAEGIAELARVLQLNDHLSSLVIASNSLCGMRAVIDPNLEPKRRRGDAFRLVGEYRPRPALELLRALRGTQVMNLLDLSNNGLGGGQDLDEGCAAQVEQVLGAVVETIRKSWLLNIRMCDNAVSDQMKQRMQRQCGERLVL